MKRCLKTFLVLICLPLSLTSCRAINKNIKHGKLETQTIVSDGVFLEQNANTGKVLFLQVRNISGGPAIDITQDVTQALEAKGYRFVTDKTAASFALQINILQVTRTLEDDVQKSGYGSALGGALAGTALTGNPIVGGTLGAGASSLTDSLTEVPRYQLIADVQISERCDSEGNWKDHRVRIVTLAKRVNLKLDKAIPGLKSSLASALAGIFA